ncbi:hypothetical protein DFQ26_002862 [Actinomortierella ambigua]|nr:hypothetical protein DFQ26_002862 [Actinomortierella ambigua]
MDFRLRIIQENGGLTEPHEKLTQTQEETLGDTTDLLMPDFTTITAASKRRLSVVLLEGKVDSNRTDR